VAFAATATVMRSAPDFENIYARFVGRRVQGQQQDTQDKKGK
jgi:hypothetical protein